MIDDENGHILSLAMFKATNTGINSSIAHMYSTATG